MRAAVYRGPGRVEVERLPIPEAGPGELLVRVRACGVCGTDLKKIHLGLVEPPRVFGHEIAGTVAAVGPGEAGFRVGDRVVAQHHVPCGACYYCDRRRYAACEGYRRTGLTAGFEPAGGGFAEYVRVLPFVRRGLVRIPPEVSFEEASFLEPLNTVLKGVRAAAVEPGETALVVGQGPIGLLFTQCLRLEGARVLAADPRPAARALAEHWGAMALDPAEADVPAACRTATDGRGTDLAVVAVAATGVVPEALAAVRPGGRVLLFAQTRLGDPLTVDAGEVCAREKTLLGSYSSDLDLQEEAAALLFSRRVETASLVTHRFPLEHIAEALALASQPSPTSLKVVVEP